ncbi:MAG: hypothetical protein ACRC4Y_08265 [Cetobacterium sp.]|uniref:hypothetical protein n=1 Tax=Cetobacterium sp. TaxID=2071632 RepID=UPI003F3AF9FF
MVINERCINILSVLNEANGFTLKKLSENFNVHIRTIRYDIDNINYILKSYKLDQIKKTDGGGLQVNLKSNDLNKIISDFGGMFSENRKSYLKLKILSKQMVNLTKEAEFLNVSRTTLKKDMLIIKSELEVKDVFIHEFASKGVSVIGEVQNIVDALEKEIHKVIDKQFVNLPNVLKDLIGKIVGDITPAVLKTRMKEVLGDNYSLIEYNKIFCRLAALNTRDKLEKNKTGYNIEEINNFILSSQGEEFILKNSLQDRKISKNGSLEEVKGILKEIIDTLEIEADDEVLEKLLNELGDIREALPIPEKMCETSFYKDFSDKIKSDILIEKDIRSIFYLLYNQLSLKKYSDFKEFKVLFICDELEFIKDLIQTKLKDIFEFKKIDKISSHIFEIFGVDDEYDLIITSGNINETLETPVYKISSFPLESNFIDLKFFLLKNIKNIKNL